MIPTLRYLRWLVLAKLGYNPHEVNPHVGLCAGARHYYSLQKDVSAR